jgi:uncharacterized membrane protein YqjE
MGDQISGFDSSADARFQGGIGDARGNASGSSDSRESIGSLLSGLLQDLQELVRGEITLARAEVREDVASASKGAATLAGSALIGVTGFIFAMLAVTYLLNQEMRMWIAAGIVGLSLLAIAGILFLIGKRKLSATNLKPDQTIDSLKEDREWAKQQVSSVKQ